MVLLDKIPGYAIISNRFTKMEDTYNYGSTAKYRDLKGETSYYVQ